MGELVVSREALTVELAAELTPFLTSASDEVEFVGWPANVNWEAYFLMDSVGNYYFYTVRTDRGALLGWCGFSVSPHPHYKDKKAANCDLIYVGKEARKTGASVKLLNYCDENLVAMGVDMISYAVKTGHDYSPVLMRKGYVADETIYTKKVGDRC